jgi:protein-S-isoprenylcysteine O-methyltransferase Ste14
VTLALRNAFFTLLEPGSVAVVIPWLILAGSNSGIHRLFWPALVMIAAGAALYAWCLWHFARVGRGTPAPWDPARHFIATGPYAWVRNPMYIAVALVIAGEAWLFASAALVAYLAIFLVVVNAFVVFYEEPTLSEQFGAEYAAYRRSVWRWIPTPPRAWR